MLYCYFGEIFEVVGTQRNAAVAVVDEIAAKYELLCHGAPSLLATALRELFYHPLACFMPSKPLPGSGKRQITNCVSKSAAGGSELESAMTV